MKTVFVIEDDTNLRMLYEEEFSDRGFHVVASCGDKRAVPLIRETNPDLVVMEPRLKTCNGQDLLRAILSTFPRIPVVICSVWACMPDRLMDCRARVDAFVLKSADWGPLYQVVQRAFRSHDSTGRTAMLKGNFEEHQLLQ